MDKVDTSGTGYPSYQELLQENQHLRVRLAAAEQALFQAGFKPALAQQGHTKKHSYPEVKVNWGLVSLMAIVLFFGFIWLVSSFSSVPSKKAARSNAVAKVHTDLLSVIRPKCASTKDIEKVLKQRGLEFTLSDNAASMTESDWGKMVLNSVQLADGAYDNGAKVQDLYHYYWKLENLEEYKKRQGAVEAHRKEEERKALAEEKKRWGNYWSMHQKHPTWSIEECKHVSEHRYWIGMTTEMMKSSLGQPRDVNVSNYGRGNQYQYCYEGGVCLYDNNDDGIIDAYN